MSTNQMRPVLARLAQRRGGGSRPKHLPDPISVWKIVRGDKASSSPVKFDSVFVCDSVWQVQVMSGKESGKQGTVLKVYRKEQKLLIQSLNLVRIR
jgi:hypothetical protein